MTHTRTFHWYYVVADGRTGLEHWELDRGQPEPINTVDRVMVEQRDDPDVGANT